MKILLYNNCLSYLERNVLSIYFEFREHESHRGAETNATASKALGIC